MDHIVVDCPRCGAAATIVLRKRSTDFAEILHGMRRLTCTHCGLSRGQSRQALSDPTMGCRLRLVASTRHGELVFYNRAHLDYVAEYLVARDRHMDFAPDGPRNATIPSRLPLWAKRAVNREEMLSAIAKVRACG